MALTGILAVTAVTAREGEIRVAASRELRVAIVDFAKASPTRDAVHQAFSTSLGESLTRQCGAPVGVRAKCVGVDHAAFNLNAGVYDAVLVIGRAVPDALRRIEAITLSAAPDAAKRDRMLYLMIAPGDTALQGLLATAFTGALNDGKFRESFAAADGRATVPAGEKVASAR